jgi:SAM-dependent methyltransferase
MMSTQERCRACNSAGLQVFFEAKQVPVHQNLLTGSESEAKNCQRGDIQLGFCKSCGFVSNLSFNPDLLAYSPEYDNTQTYSPTFRGYLEELALDLINRYNLQHKQIVEIGCGNGEFLNLLCDFGNNVGIGFDPSYSDREWKHERIRFIRDMYSGRYANHQGDLVCCRHVLEHIQDPAGMIATVRRSIGQRGDVVVFIEVPTLTWILRNVTFWDIFYEHCSYFTAGSLTRLFTACGFNVTRLSEAFRDQYLWMEATPRLNKIQIDPHFDEIETPGDTSKDIELFTNLYKEKVQRIHKQIYIYLSAGKNCVVWGAGAKGVTFLNTLNLTTDQIESVVDINPVKQGLYVPGTGQQVIGPEQLPSLDPNVILLMNPNYLNEIEVAVTKLGLKAEIVLP